MTLPHERGRNPKKAPAVRMTTWAHSLDFTKYYDGDPPRPEDSPAAHTAKIQAIRKARQTAGKARELSNKAAKKRNARP